MINRKILLFQIFICSIWSCYPNGFNISFISDKIDNFSVTVVDAFGKKIVQEIKDEYIGEYTKKVDLSTYPKGVYMVQIRTADSFVSKRVVIQ